MSRRPRALAGLIAAAIGLLLLPVSALAQSPAASPFADWAAVVVAGDWHAHSGGPTEAFDNARRDVAVAFEKAGFAPGNVQQFSVRPERYPAARPNTSTVPQIAAGLQDLVLKATGGCLVYVTSHGAPPGVLIGAAIVSPNRMEGLVDKACGKRPTVVIISACYSGVFLPALAGANRMVMTAARPDRSSFGCTESDRYPYYDDCILQSLPQSSDFLDLAHRARACIDRREAIEGLRPASEPQVQVGATLRPMIPLYTFTKP
jgi:hypothetical protein